jgi:hypothetical protein
MNNKASEIADALIKKARIRSFRKIYHGRYNAFGDGEDYALLNTKKQF